MNVESALGVLAGRTKLQQVEHRLDVRVKAIVALAGESDVTAAQVRDGLRRVTVQSSLRGHAVAGRILAVVALVVKRSGDALIIWRNDTGAQTSAAVVVPAMVHLRDGVGLHQILGRVADV